MFLKKEFHCGTYPVHYWVILSNEPNKAKKFIDSKLGADEPTNDEELAWAGLFCSIDGPPPVLVIHINIDNEPNEILKAVIHELAHACFWVMEWASITLSDSTSEAYTHLLDKMVGDVIPWVASKKLLKL